MYYEPGGEVMSAFPAEFTAHGARVLESAGEVMDARSEAAAFEGTAEKMWRWLERPFADRAIRQLPRGGRILDLGTGPGLIPVHWTATRPDAEVVAVDLSAAMLELAGSRARRAGVDRLVKFVRADATHTGLPGGSFDVVACHYVLHHFSDPVPLLREAARLAGPKGIVLIRDLTRPPVWLARVSTGFGKWVMRNDAEQNRQYAESLAASFTACEIRGAIAGASLEGWTVRGGPIHIEISRRPVAGKRHSVGGNQ
jgi:ubiquinone/menaquinone biosynthesis C-methylase UbiE